MSRSTVRYRLALSGTFWHFPALSGTFWHFLALSGTFRHFPAPELKTRILYRFRHLLLRFLLLRPQLRLLPAKCSAMTLPFPRRMRLRLLPDRAKVDSHAVAVPLRYWAGSSTNYYFSVGMLPSPSFEGVVVLLR